MTSRLVGIVETFNKAKGDFVFYLAEGGNTIPMSLDKLSEVLIGFESLPFERGFLPLCGIKELACTSL